MIPQIKDVKKIAVFRALQLGDMLCAVPAFRSLRSAFPNAEIILIGLPWAKSFTERFSDYFDKFISFPGYPGLPEQPFDEEKFDAFIQKIKKEKIDLLIQMQGNGTIVNGLLLQFEASMLAGFYNEKSFIDSPLFMPYPNFGAEKKRHLLLMEHLGIESKGNHLEFPLTTSDEKDYNALHLPVEPKSYIVVHPGSRGAWRQWPPEYFALIADFCIESGFHIVITGTIEESKITTEVINYMHNLPINLTGKTNLGAMAVLVRNAFAVVSNCTGVSHIADALDTPSVIISMDGEPQRWSPENKNLHKVIDWTIAQSFNNVLHQTENLLNELSVLKT